MCIDRPWLRRLCGSALLALASVCVRAELLELREAAMVGEDGSAVDVSLPWVWDRLRPGVSGQAHLRLSWTAAPASAQPLAVFIPKAGNAFEVSLNGSVLLRQGDMDREGSSDHGKLPLWLALPQELVREHNRIDIRLRADAGRRAGLSTVWVGPHEEVRRKYGWQHADRYTLTLFILSLSLGVGLLAFALAWTQRGLSHPQDVQNRWIFMAAGVAETSWGLRLADSIWLEPPLPWPAWSVLSSLAYLLWIGGALVFCHHACGLRMRGLRPVVTIFVLLGLLSALAGRIFSLSWPWTIWMASTAAGLLVYGLGFTAVLLARPSGLRLLVALSAVSNIVAGAWNWWVFRWQGDPMGAGSAQRYTSVLFTLVLLVILLQRFRQASVGMRESIALLDQRIAQKERELSEIFQLQEDSAREQERQRERLRIWRELHDGLGAHLNAALRQLQAPQFDRAVLFSTLREGLMQLKLSVDAANLPAGDLGVMLGNLRYRLTPAFVAAGLDLQWDVQALPAVPALGSPQALRELQFIVYEAISNVLQHGSARRLHIQGLLASGGVCLCLMDDGVDWTPHLAVGRGLRSMQDRASALGLTLELSREGELNRISLFIPLVRQRDEAVGCPR